jgi:peptide chain release factor 1
MIDKLQALAERYESLQQKQYDPDIVSDIQQSKKINQELASLKEAYDLYLLVKKRTDQYNEAKMLLDNELDADILDLAKMQLAEAEEQLAWAEQQIQIALLPQDPNDAKNIFLEIRPAAWWDESWLFASELMRMYLRFAENQWRKAEIMEHQTTWIWWLKFAMIKIAWQKVYSKLKFESGVHRVQRIPDTESQWRIHTSTVTVAAMPEVDDVEITIDPNDVEMDTFAASSAWWQHANKNQTGVRLHHKPSWLIVMGTDSKSQLQNKENARKMLKVRLYQLELDKKIQEQKEKRFDQIWTWDRSEKIRTYNFPQDRVTDHRIKQSRPNIPSILDGNIEAILDAVILENQMKLLDTSA